MKLAVTLRTLKSVYIKQSLYRPGQTLRVPGFADFKVVRSAVRTGRLYHPSIFPGNIPDVHVC
jgi:hypothetical protein